MKGNIARRAWRFVWREIQASSVATDGGALSGIAEMRESEDPPCHEPPAPSDGAYDNSPYPAPADYVPAPHAREVHHLSDTPWVWPK